MLLYTYHKTRHLLTRHLTNRQFHIYTFRFRSWHSPFGCDRSTCLFDFQPVRGYPEIKIWTTYRMIEARKQEAALGHVIHCVRGIDSAGGNAARHA